MKTLIFLLTFVVSGTLFTPIYAAPSVSFKKNHVTELTIEDGGAVVPDPIKKRYTFRKSNAENHVVYMDYKEYTSKKTMFTASTVLSIDDAIKAWDLMDAVASIENGKTITHKNGEGCVGSSGKQYSAKMSNGTTSKFDVTGSAFCEGDNVPVALSGLNAIAQATAEQMQSSAKGRAGNVIKRMKNTTWQSTKDPNVTLKIRNNRMIYTKKGVIDPAKSFVYFTNRCPEDKPEGEGMSAGFICCMVTYAQDEVRYRVLDCDDTTFSFIRRDNDEGLETFSLVKTKTKVAKK
jgi:hypothetical protein